MKCDYCKTQEAVIHIQLGMGAKCFVLDFCIDCANRFGIHTENSEIKMSFKDLSSNISILKDIAQRKLSEKANNGFESYDQFNKNVSSAVHMLGAAENQLCPVCGCSLATVLKKAKVGCPECYEIFKKTIQDKYTSKGLSGPYCGTMPHRLANFKSIINDRIVLQNKLRESIESEDYEKAALYRDRINALNDCHNSNSSGFNGGADFE